MNIWFLIISFIVGVLCGIFGGAYFAFEYKKYGVNEKRTQ